MIRQTHERKSQQSVILKPYSITINNLIVVSKYVLAVFWKTGSSVQASISFLYIWCKKTKWLADFKHIDFHSGFWWLFPIWPCGTRRSPIFNSGVFSVRSTGPSYSCRKFRSKCTVVKQIQNIDDHKNKQLFIKIWFPFWDVQINGIIYTLAKTPKRDEKHKSCVIIQLNRTILLNYIFLYNCTKDTQDTWIMNSLVFSFNPSYTSGNILFYNQDICNLVNMCKEDSVYQNDNTGNVTGSKGSWLPKYCQYAMNFTSKYKSNLQKKRWNHHGSVSTSPATWRHQGWI